MFDPSDSVPSASSREHPVLFGRLLSRAQALQLLFQAENSYQSMEQVLASDYVVTDGPADDFAQLLATQTYQKRGLLDSVLQAVSTNWNIDRFAEVDRNILRLALYEILFSDEIATAGEAIGMAEKDTTVDEEVAINEAVRLSKIFGGEDSYQFVNGILGRIVRDSSKGVDFLRQAADTIDKASAAEKDASAEKGAEAANGPEAEVEASRENAADDKKDSAAKIESNAETKADAKQTE